MMQARDHYRGKASDGEIEILTDQVDVGRAIEAARRRLRDKGLPESWASTGKVFEDEYATVYRDPVRFPDGGLGTYLRIAWAERFGDGVAILPRLNGGFVLTRHFRHASRSWHWEIPRGFGDPIAPSSSNARRELMEEIGATPTALLHLGAVYPDAGITDNEVHVFLADIDCIGALGRPEGISDAQIKAPGELMRMIAAGEISDGITLAAVSLAIAKGHLA